MSFFLGRVFKLGAALIARGFGREDGASLPALHPIVEVCVTRAHCAAPAIVRPYAIVPVAREVTPSVDVRRQLPLTPRVTRPVPSC